MEAQSASTGQNVGRLISTVLIASSVVLVVQRLRSWYRLRQFKGPLLASFSRIWLVRKVVGGTMHLDFQEVNAKYGKWMWTWERAHDAMSNTHDLQDLWLELVPMISSHVIRT